MADVFLAHDNVLDRDVALKVMNSRYARDEEFVERFRREAQSAAGLAHPNIVSIYDRGESEDGTYYIAMEYLSGGTLKDRILKRGALPPKTAASVAAQIAEALKGAHDRGVVHRDIKPHNILITEAGDIKVTDFGIARAASSSTMTKTGAVMGTAHYISPEQAMGESVGPASDLYSLGVLLYEMATGELPFDADTPIGIAMKHVNGTPPPPAEVNPAVPAGLNAIVVRLLQKDPNDRYATDDELIEDLERVARGEAPTSAASTQVMGQLDRTQLLGAGAAGVAGNRTNAMPKVGRQNTEPGFQRQKKQRRFLPIFLILLFLALIGFGAYSLLSGTGEPQENDNPQAQEIDVPDLSGLTFDEAQRQVGERFELIQGDEENSPEEQGTVLDQNPSSGGTLTEGSEIELTTASGSNAIPEVDNLTRQNAAQDIREAGFEVEIEERESDEAESGRVISQNPGAGASEEVGSTVTITVGSGPELVLVPDIPYGATQSEAQTLLQSEGLVLGNVTETTSNEIAEGGVVDQNPGPSEEVEEGSPVDIVLSSGPEQTEVPDVVGQDVNSAMESIAALGLGYTTVGVESSEPEGTVVSQDPAGGTLLTLDENAIVTLTFSLGTQQVVEEEPQNPVGTEEENASPSQPSQNGNEAQPNSGNGGNGNNSGQPISNDNNGGGNSGEQPAGGNDQSGGSQPGGGGGQRDVEESPVQSVVPITEEEAGDAAGDDSFESEELEE